MEYQFCYQQPFGQYAQPLSLLISVAHVITADQEDQHIGKKDTTGVIISHSFKELDFSPVFVSLSLFVKVC